MCRPTNENKSTALIWVFSIKRKTKSVYFSPESLDQHQHEFAVCKLQIESPLGSPGNHVELRCHMEVGGLCLSVKCGEIETVQGEFGGGRHLSVDLHRDLVQQESLSPMFSLGFCRLALWQMLGLSGSWEMLYQVGTVWENSFIFCPLKTWTSVSNKVAATDQALCQQTVHMYARQTMLLKSELKYFVYMRFKSHDDFWLG